MNSLEKELEKIESMAYKKGIDIESGWLYQEIIEGLDGDYDEDEMKEKIETLKEEIKRL